MNNYFLFLLAGIVSLQVYANVVVANKIDATLNFINEELVASTITEKSKMDAYENNDISLLAIDHYLLMNLVETTLNSNLNFSTNKANYYFYDSITYRTCKIGNYTCNSVQMKIQITYQNKTFEEIVRYEPIQI